MVPVTGELYKPYYLHTTDKHHREPGDVNKAGIPGRSSLFPTMILYCKILSFRVLVKVKAEPYANSTASGNDSNCTSGFPLLCWYHFVKC